MGTKSGWLVVHPESLCIWSSLPVASRSNSSQFSIRNLTPCILVNDCTLAPSVARVQHCLMPAEIGSGKVTYLLGTNEIKTQDFC